MVKQIDSSMFTIITNQLAFPANINENAIVYSPSLNSRERLSGLMMSLSTLGFNVSSASLISENNHSFTENNVGVFLLPNDVNVEQETDVINNYQFPIVNEYGATNCRHSTTLYLKEPDEFFIEVDIWKEEHQRYQQKSYHGKWQLTDKNILILSNKIWSKPLTFIKQTFEENTFDQKRKVLSFTPEGIGIENKQQQSVQCTYTISLVM